MCAVTSIAPTIDNSIYHAIYSVDYFHVNFEFKNSFHIFTSLICIFGMSRERKRHFLHVEYDDRSTPCEFNLTVNSQSKMSSRLQELHPANDIDR